ncbi:MAG: [FeFe] hydrogenase H-cluster radical SAM maturase HydG [Candidatus Omnitrophica bacterium]|nr:[FeFe] hydrogenase H-cluster radical SAM maturase HydG [Candidatus Omnitrophota bacterium]
MSTVYNYSLKDWMKEVIKEEEIVRYLDGEQDFINDEEIWGKLRKNVCPSPSHIREILKKSLSIQTLEPDETASLLNVKDEALWEEIFETASVVKKKVYDNRIVTFAPLYCSSYCVNNCLYCAFRSENNSVKRKKLSLEEIKREVEVLTGEVGHKRLIVVYGEHPSTDVDYIVDTIKIIYGVQVNTKNGYSSIRRVNVNASPMAIEDLRKLKEVGIGTYQVFQETYHHETYKRVHPQDTIKSNYQWRLYCMHRALEAGIDDVGIGVLFGLYDWRFEVMGLLYHTRELEKKFGIGPHTISFPRLEPAFNTPFVQETKYKVSDGVFKKLIAVIRLAIPYTGMIITAREPKEIRREMFKVGCTQTDASTKIGIGAYSDRYNEQEAERQQFLLGDTRSLDEVIRDFAQMGYITSFCTAGYRCGRTGECIMELLKSGKEAKFCKLNAILTFREWLDDFASEETKTVAEKVILGEMEEVKRQIPSAYPKLLEYYERIKNGERDIYF